MTTFSEQVEIFVQGMIDTFGTVEDAIVAVATQVEVQMSALVQGTTITIRRGDTNTINLTGMGDISNRTKLWFTAKIAKYNADSAALVQIEESDGLLYINGAVATSANGSIVVTDEAAGDITITLKAVESAKLSVTGLYDVQVKRSTGVVTTLAQGSFVVALDVTKTVG